MTAFVIFEIITLKLSSFVLEELITHALSRMNSGHILTPFRYSIHPIGLFPSGLAYYMTAYAIFAVVAVTLCLRLF
jgi:hypothetical protein